MGPMMLDDILSIMNAGGIRTQRAYPGKPMPQVDETVAAVSLQKAELTTGETQIKVLILSHSRLGAGACEDTAMAAARALKSAGYACQVSSVEFDGRSGHFCTAILVSNPVDKRLKSFKIGAVPQQYVVSFTAQRKVEEPETDLETAGWTVKLEQFFPVGATEDSDPNGSQFTLTNGSEIYHGCSWVSQMRVTEADGTRQIREGTAMSRTT